MLSEGAPGQESESDFFTFITGKEHEQGSIDDHLRYLRIYSGTPDFTARADSFDDAAHEAQQASPATITNQYFDVISVVD